LESYMNLLQQVRADLAAAKARHGDTFDHMTVAQLKTLAKSLGLVNTWGDTKAAWIAVLRQPRTALEHNRY
jgi:hypothetical protein